MITNILMTGVHMTLNIALTLEQQQWAAEQVTQGRVASPEEAVLEAVETQRIYARIEQSKESVKAGRFSPADEVFDRVEARIQAKFGDQL